MSEGIPQSFIDANSCGIMPEFDEAGKTHMRDKAARVPVECQAFGHMSDEWVADRVRMLRHRDLDHEAICCAARDRIMRLSLRMAELSASVHACNLSLKSYEAKASARETAGDAK